VSACALDLAWYDKGKRVRRGHRAPTSWPGLMPSLRILWAHSSKPSELMMVR